jgi:hypothetical protein
MGQVEEVEEHCDGREGVAGLHKVGDRENNPYLACAGMDVVGAADRHY